MRLITSTKSTIRLLVLALAIGVTPAIAVATASSASAAPSCAVTWGSRAKSLDGTTNASVTNARAGRHACFDRMVVDLNGTGEGYRVEYVNTLTGMAGTPLALRGGAKIQVTVRTRGHMYHPTTMSEAVNVRGYTTFRQIRCVASGGVTKFGLGVRARLPMRAFILRGPGIGSRLVIDVAHHW